MPHEDCDDMVRVMDELNKVLLRDCDKSDTQVNVRHLCCNYFSTCKVLWTLIV